MWTFNDTLDESFIKPVSRGYKAVAPEPLRNMVRNFFSNVDDVFNGANNMLQGKFLDGWTDWFRVIVNTTFGVLGINDVASDMRLEKHNEDFGQTLGWWGVPPGPYFVIPFLGPSTLRDAPARWVDPSFAYNRGIDEIAIRNSMFGLDLVRTRAELLKAAWRSPPRLSAEQKRSSPPD